MPGSEISNALEDDGFAASFVQLKLGRESKEDDMEVGKSKVGTALHRFVTRPCALSRASTIISKVMSTEMHKNNGTGLA